MCHGRTDLAVSEFMDIDGHDVQGPILRGQADEVTSLRASQLGTHDYLVAFLQDRSHVNGNPVGAFRRSDGYDVLRAFLMAAHEHHRHAEPACSSPAP